MATESAPRSGKKLRLVLITFAVMVVAFGLLFLLTEDEGSAPFVYAIF